jgi:hypothetical protein
VRDPPDPGLRAAAREAHVDEARRRVGAARAHDEEGEPPAGDAADDGDARRRGRDAHGRGAPGDAREHRDGLARAGAWTRTRAVRSGGAAAAAVAAGTVSSAQARSAAEAERSMCRPSRPRPRPTSGSHP